MIGVLDRIVEKKRERLGERKVRVSVSEIKSKAYDAEPPRDFSGAIKRSEGEKIRLIAELKKASPFRGLLRGNFNLVEISKIYEEKGVSAISVITEEDFFQGDIEFISVVKGSTGLPVIRKDFIFDEYQAYEARAYGADAILLIASILSRTQAEELFHLSSELDLSVLFEVHHWRELNTALFYDVPIIGINNRDLKTLTVNLNTTIELLKDIPEGKTVVSESGIETKRDVEFLEKSRVDALLVGTVLMETEDIGQKIDELFEEPL